MSVISLEPRPTVTADNDDNETTIWQYEAPDGKIVQDEFDSPTSTLTRRIMAAYSHLGPGKFRDLTADLVRKQAESGDGPKVEPTEATETHEEDEKPVDELMSLEEMNAMKQEVFETLSSAWQELSFISELSRSLIPGQPYPYTDTRLGPPYVPPNALTVSHIHRPTKYIAREIEDAKLALARQSRDIQRAAHSLSSAAGRMRSRQARTETYWKDLTALRYGTKAGGGGGPWPLLPKWTVDGTPESKQIAKDVMVPYAIDEAAPHIRLRALAVLESDEPEGSTANASAGNARFGLSLPARRGRRMRVLLTSASGKRSSRIPHAESQNAGAMLQQAQDEAFDEEVFEQILGEARSMQLLDARISMERVTFRPAPDLELSFEMIDPNDDLDEPLLGDSQPDLILAIVRLAMLRIYRHRKAYQAALFAQTGALPSPARPILATVVPYLHYQAFITQMISILEAYQSQLKSIGFVMKVVRDDGGASGGMDWTSLLAEKPEEVQAQSMSRGVDLVIGGRQIASILVSLSCQITLALPDTTLVSQDLAQLPTFLAPALRMGILGILRDDLNDREIISAVDELQGALLTRDIKLVIELGELPAEISAVAHIRRLKGSMDPNGDVRIKDGVDVEVLGGQDVRRWLAERAGSTT